MAIFNDLAIEVQEAIWELVLPASRGVHWIEVEGISETTDYIRESIRMTNWHRFDRIPEKYLDINQARRRNPICTERFYTNTRDTSAFFRYFLATVPAVFGQSETGKTQDPEGLSMSDIHQPTALYRLVDSVPRPDWNHDYPAVIRDIFAGRMAEEREEIWKHINAHWKLMPEDQAALSADHHLGQEFEAKGRRYYIVFVFFDQFLEEERDKLEEAGPYWSGPFPGSAAMWPEALREPVRLAYDVHADGSSNLGTHRSSSYILSWEPI